MIYFTVEGLGCRRYKQVRGFRLLGLRVWRFKVSLRTTGLVASSRGFRLLGLRVLGFRASCFRDCGSLSALFIASASRLGCCTSDRHVVINKLHENQLQSS